MRRLHAWLCAAAVVALALPGDAKPWSGIEPGDSSKIDVERHFGKPTKPFKPNTPAFVEAWSYQFEKGHAERRGVRQANFYFDTKGTCKRIDVFPTSTLKLKNIEGAYGDKTQYRRGLTASFQLYLHYPEQGLAVFFDDDGDTVFSLQFLESAVPQRRAAPAGATGQAHDRVRFKPTTSQ